MSFDLIKVKGTVCGATAVVLWLAIPAACQQPTPRESVYKRLKDLAGVTLPSYFALKQSGDLFFALELKAYDRQPLLITLKSPGEPTSEHVVLDPNTMKGPPAIDYYLPSHNGRLVAVSLSDLGATLGTLHVYDVQSGKPLPDVIPRVSFAATDGSLAWNSNGSGFYYLRPPDTYSKDSPLTHIYFHKLGTPATRDSISLGREFPARADVTLNTSKDGRFIEATVAGLDGAILSYNILGPSDHWVRIETITSTGCTFRRTPEVLQCRQDCEPVVNPIRGPSLAQCLAACAELGKICPPNSPPGSATITIPYDVIQGLLRVALSGSRIQLSHMEHGEPRDIKQTRLICTFRTTREVIECRQECGDLVQRTGMTMAQCLSGCAQLGRTCNNVTREFPEYSYIWFTPE